MKAQERAVPVRSEMEFRVLPNGGTHFRGYAAVFDTDSEPMPFIERVAPSAFTRTLAGRSNQTFVLNHDDNLLLASRRTGRLNLSSDGKGLLTEAELPDTSYASDLRSLDAVREVWGMSFTFAPTRGGAPYSSDGTKRTLTDVALGHVTVLTGLQPAYPATTGMTQIRSLAAAIKADPDEVDAVLDHIRLGEPLDARDYQILLDICVQLNPSPEDEPGAVPAVDAPMDDVPMAMSMGRSIEEVRAALVARGII